MGVSWFWSLERPGSDSNILVSELANQMAQFLLSIYVGQRIYEDVFLGKPYWNEEETTGIERQSSCATPFHFTAMGRMDYPPYSRTSSHISGWILRVLYVVDCGYSPHAMPIGESLGLHPLESAFEHLWFRATHSTLMQEHWKFGFGEREQSAQ